MGYNTEGSTRASSSYSSSSSDDETGRSKELLAANKKLRDKVKSKEAALKEAVEQLKKRATAIIKLDETNKRQKKELEQYENLVSTRGVKGANGVKMNQSQLFECKIDSTTK